VLGNELHKIIKPPMPLTILVKDRFRYTVEVTSGTVQDIVDRCLREITWINADFFRVLQSL